MSEEATLTLYRHTKKPEWGTAVIAWERDGKRAYLFDSGMVKVLAEPFYTLMAPVEAESAELAIRLTGHLERSALSSRTRTAASVRFSLQQQVDWFAEEYPGGFNGEAWEKKARGSSDMRRLKRHRMPAIADAQVKLSSDRLNELAASPTGAVDAARLICDLLSETDLVAAAQLSTLKRRAAKAPANLPQLIHDLLHSPNPEDTAPLFDSLVGALGQILGASPSWELSTSLLALVRPGIHVCVRRAAFAKQAEWMMPDANLTKQPSSLGYAGFLRLAHEVNDRLTELGHTPDDLFDVHDFIRFSTTTSAQHKMSGESPTSSLGDDGTDDDVDSEAA
jgi:hypothetical protein